MIEAKNSIRDWGIEGRKEDARPKRERFKLSGAGGSG